MPGLLKVRPFDREVSFAGQVPLRFRGAIEDKTLVIFFGASSFILPASVGVDEHGSFAVVEPTQQDLPFGFELIVEQGFDEDEPPGVQISLREITAFEKAHRKEHPDKNVICPPGMALSVHFNSDGVVDGFSGASEVSAKTHEGN